MNKHDSFYPFEKRLEIHASALSFMLAGEDYWQQFCNEIGTKIIGEKTNRHCFSFILSLSTLIVWPNRMVLLSCSSCTLNDCIKILSKKFDIANFDYIAAEERSHLENFHSSPMAGLGDPVKWEEKVHPHRIEKSYGKRVEQFKSIQTKLFLSQDRQLDLRKVENSLVNDFPNSDLIFYKFKNGGISVNGTNGNGYYSLHYSPELYASFETDLFEDDLNNSRIISLLT